MSMISRRQLLQSIPWLPFLGVLKPSEPPVEAKATVEPPYAGTKFVREFRDTPNSYEVTEYESAGYLYSLDENGKWTREELPATVEPGKQYWCVAGSTGAGMAFKPSRAGTITKIHTK